MAAESSIRLKTLSISAKIGEPLYYGSKLKSTNVEYIDEDPIMIEDFRATLCLMLIDGTINESLFEQLDNLCQMLIDSGIDFMPDLIDQHPILLDLCIPIVEIIRTNRKVEAISKILPSLQTKNQKPISSWA